MRATVACKGCGVEGTLIKDPDGYVVLPGEWGERYKAGVITFFCPTCNAHLKRTASLSLRSGKPQDPAP